MAYKEVQTDRMIFKRNKTKSHLEQCDLVFAKQLLGCEDALYEKETLKVFTFR